MILISPWFCRRLISRSWRIMSGISRRRHSCYWRRNRRISCISRSWRIVVHLLLLLLSA